MSERVRYEFASIQPVRGWTRSTVLQSPRGKGAFEIDPIAGEPGDPNIEFSTLKERVQRALTLYKDKDLISEPFDCVDWEAAPIACHGFTVVWREGPIIQRQWHLISKADMVVASYKNKNGDDALHDLFDCEEMVRSIRFDRQLA
jgi:hypothetical protein